MEDRLQHRTPIHMPEWAHPPVSATRPKIEALDRTPGVFAVESQYVARPPLISNAAPVENAQSSLSSQVTRAAISAT